MHSQIVIMIAIAIYLCGMIGIGIYFTRQNKKSDDFYLGGRKLGPLVTAMSAEASDMSGWLLMGLPAVALMTGLAEASWTAIGLAIGMVINMLVFPYDNSRRIRSAVESLDTELIAFLEDMFDGDDHLPGAEEMTRKIDDMAAQLELFAGQRLFWRRKRQRRQLEAFRICRGKARELVARMEVLCQMERPGRLSDENRRRLTALGAVIRDERPLEAVTERDVVTNYHVRQILDLRRQLLEVLRSSDRQGKA